MKIRPALILGLLVFIPIFSHAQISNGQTTEVKAIVLNVIKDTTQTVPGTDTSERVQTLSAKIAEGSDAGIVVTLDDDLIPLSKGDSFYLGVTTNQDGTKSYSFVDAYRLPALLFFALLFIALVLLIGGLQGLRGLLSLIGSFVLILFVLLPGILQGYSPVLVSVAVSSLIIVVGSYITHGFNKTTSSAVAGMILTVIVTGALAFWAVGMTKLTGLSTDEAFYVSLNSKGTIDIVGILLGGIMIGVLGVLYDVAIGQAISVEELHKIAPHIPRRTIFARALRIGREHIGALVNTLAIAYVGASLPLLLLFIGNGNLLLTLNREIFATEIIRILIGSIGLVLAVPVTTLLSVLILMREAKTPGSAAMLTEEKKAIDHFHHHH